MSRQMQYLAGKRAGVGDGVASSAFFDQPKCVSQASNGDLWIADKGNVRLRCLIDEGIVTSLTGATTPPYTAVGTSWRGATRVAPNIKDPIHLAHGRSNEAFLVDGSAGAVRKVVAGQVLAVVEEGLRSHLEGLNRRLVSPNAVRVDPLGDIWIANTGCKEIIHVTNIAEQTKEASVLHNWRHPQILASSFSEPLDVAFPHNQISQIIVADGSSLKVLDRLTSNVELYAGQSESGFKDGWRGTALFGKCNYLLSGPIGDIFVTDTINRVIRRVSALGYVSTFIGAENPLSPPPLPLGTPSLPDTYATMAKAREEKLPDPYPRQQTTKPVFTGNLLTPESCCFNLNGDLIIPDSSRHLLFVVRRAQVHPEKKWQIGKIGDFDAMSITTAVSKELKHLKSGMSWNILEPTLALASREILDPSKVFKYLENSEASSTCIEILLNLFQGSQPEIRDIDVFMDVLVRYGAKKKEKIFFSPFPFFEASKSSPNIPFLKLCARLNKKKHIIELKLFDIFEENALAFANYLASLSQLSRDDLKSKMKDSEEMRSNTILRDLLSRLLARFGAGEVQKSIESEPFCNRPYRGDGFLREQIERLYWATVWDGFPTLVDGYKQPTSLFEIDPASDDDSETNSNSSSSYTASTSKAKKREDAKRASKNGKSKLDEGVGSAASPSSPAAIPSYLQPNLEIFTIDGSVMCHDWVLIPRWRFVKGMFAFAGEETKSRRVSLEDVGITKQALQYILCFMYTDRLELLNDDKLRLSIHKWSTELHLSDFDGNALFGCERLIHHTTKPFAQPLELENAIPTYLAAVEGGSEIHQQRALQFIAKNLKAMMESDRREAELQTLDPQVLTTIMFMHFNRTYHDATPSSSLPTMQ